MMDYSIEPRVTGLLLGTAAGDSLGLPGEHLGRKRWLRRFPGPLRQRFLFGHGMISDDTEHTIMAARTPRASCSPSAGGCGTGCCSCRPAAAGGRCVP